MMGRTLDQVMAGLPPAERAAVEGEVRAMMTDPTAVTPAALWELVNPSDPITFRTDDFEALAAAVVMLSQGRYGVREVGGRDRRTPLFFLGGPTGLEAWWRQNFGHDFTVRGLELRMADALDTVVIGSVADRADHDAAVAAIDDPVKRAAFILGWTERHRTSSNDIVTSCRAYAAKLRKHCGA